MAREFTVSRSRIRGQLGRTERTILQNFFASIITLLDDENDDALDPLAALVGWNPDAKRPENPALLRLLPDAVVDDDEAANELRALTERSIRQSKLGALQAASLALDAERLDLTKEQAELFARALNDGRLVLATQLEITSASDNERLHAQLEEEADFDDELSQASAELYSFLGYLQMLIIDALDELNAQTREDSE